MSAFWLKPEDRVRPEWFAPLEQLSLLVATDVGLPQINPDHFLYTARIQRNGRPDIHVYRHVGTRRFLNVDDAGDVWRYTGRDNVGYDRYAQYVTIEEALDGADLLRGNLLMGHARSSVCARWDEPGQPTDLEERQPVAAG